MNEKSFKIENLDVFQPLSPEGKNTLVGGLTLALDYPPPDVPERDDVLPSPSKPFYPLPIPCHSYPPRIPYPGGTKPYPIRGVLPWCAVIL